MEKRVVLDTNILVAAGFNPESASAEIIRAIISGEISFVWNIATRVETRNIIEQIPPLSWEDFAGLFEPHWQYTGETDPRQFTMIKDPDDRKFAALAAASSAALVSNDDHLLSVRDQLGVEVLAPEEFVRQWRSL